MEAKTLIGLCLVAVVSCMLSAVFFSYHHGLKARPVYIKAADANHKLPDIFREAGISYTEDQLSTIYRRLNLEKEKIGF